MLVPVVDAISSTALVVASRPCNLKLSIIPGWITSGLTRGHFSRLTAEIWLADKDTSQLSLAIWTSSSSKCILHTSQCICVCVWCMSGFCVLQYILIVCHHWFRSLTLKPVINSAMKRCHICPPSLSRLAVNNFLRCYVENIYIYIYMVENEHSHRSRDIWPICNISTSEKH